MRRVIETGVLLVAGMWTGWAVTARADRDAIRDELHDVSLRAVRFDVQVQARRVDELKRRQLTICPLADCLRQMTTPLRYTGEDR